MKALVGAFNQENALVGAFPVIVQLHRLIDLRNNTERQAAAPWSWRHRVTLHWSLCGQSCSEQRTGDCVLCRALWTVLLLHYLKHKYRVVTWHCVLLLNIAAHHSRKMQHDPHCRGRGGNLDQVVNFQNYKTAFFSSPHPIIPWWPRPASRYQLPTANLILLSP